MKPQDAFYYAGLIAGMIIGTWFLRGLGAPGILQLAGGLVLGVGLGYVAEQVYGGDQHG